MPLMLDTCSIFLRFSPQSGGAGNEPLSFNSSLVVLEKLVFALAYGRLDMLVFIVYYNFQVFQVQPVIQSLPMKSLK